MVLDWIGVVAEIFGVAMDSVLFVEHFITRRNKNMVSDPLKLLYLMKGPTSVWKQVHLQYSVIRPSFEKLNRFMHDKEGIPKKKIDTKKIQTIFCDPTFADAVYKHELKLEESMRIISRSFSNADIEEKLSSISNEGIRNALITIYEYKREIERIHIDVCDFFKLVRVLLMKIRWNDDDISVIKKYSKIYTNDCNAIIDYTDIVVMKVLEIYEFALNALKPN